MKDLSKTHAPPEPAYTPAGLFVPDSDGYRSPVRDFNDYLLHECEGEGLTPGTLARYFARPAVAGQAARTRARKRAAIKQACEKTLLSIPGGTRLMGDLEMAFRAVDIPTPKWYPQHWRFMTKYQVEIVSDALPPIYSCMTRVLYSAALRISELVNLKLEDMEPARDGVCSARIRGRGNRERMVPILAELVEEARDLTGSSRWLFESRGRHGDRAPGPYRREPVWKRVQAAGREALARRVTPHDFRHSWATYAIQAGMPIDAVSRFLGHSSVEVTMRYLHNYIPEDFGRDMVNYRGKPEPGEHVA